MANDQNNQDKQNSRRNGNALDGKPVGKGNVEQTAISLSQAILSPLDAVFKAQLHGARSFLNMLLQIGYRGTNEESEQKPNSKKASGEPFSVEFKAEVSQETGSKKFCLSVPALSLVPIQPIAIQNAEYEFEMDVKAIYKHRQLQGSRVEKDPGEDDKPRPWYLVRQPVSIRGVLATPPVNSLKGSEEELSEKEISKGSIIKVKVKVDRTPMPAGLSKMLTSLTEMARIEEGQD